MMDSSQCPGYLSATDFSIHEDQADDIARVAAYHRRDFCLSVIWFPPRQHDAIRQSIATPFHRTSTAAAGLGILDRLPPELLHDIVLRLDMQTVFKVRQTNLRAREVVVSLMQYQMVVSHGLILFCALLRTPLAMHISLCDFYDALSTENCAICGRFAGFVFLLTWTRCCFQCLLSAPETRVQSLVSAQKEFQLKRAESSRLAMLRTLPGRYSMGDHMRISRIRIVSTHQARKSVAGRARHPSPSAPAEVETGPNHIFRFMASCALPYYDSRTRRVERGMSCSGCQLAFENGIIGYRGEAWASLARDMVYSQDGFLDHFRRCEQAQRLWKASGEGKHRPSELPECARRGGGFKWRD